MKNFKISDHSTTPPKGAVKKEIEKITKQRVKEIARLHKVLIAEKKHSLLIILQGMDASGKDGTVEAVFGECSAIGLKKYNFSSPTKKELAHDFLWRVHQIVPEGGEIVIFNRSHYEDILIQRVHKWIDEDRVKVRMRAINDFEYLLTHDNNTTVLKFFLNISYKEQENQLMERINFVEKRFKHNDNDWEERKHWKEYMDAYEYAIRNSEFDWTIVPVDKRWYRNYIISGVVLEALQKLNLEYPKHPELDNFKPK